MKYDGCNPLIQSLVSNLSSNSTEELDSWRNLRVVEPDSTMNKADLDVSVLLADQIESEKIIDLLLTTGIRHLIQLSNLDAKSSLVRTATLLTEKMKILSSPISVILDQVDINQLHINVAAGADKETLLESVRSYLKTVPKMTTIRDSGIIIANELLMNILYDAPKYYLTHFKAPKSGTEDGAIIGEITMAYDQNKILIGAKDIFGSLDIVKLLSRLQETFQSQTVAVNLDPGSGAGLGCRMIFDLSTEIYFSVKKGEGTFVGACLPLGVSYKKQQLTPKNVHVLEVE